MRRIKILEDFEMQILLNLRQKFRWKDSLKKKKKKKKKRKKSAE